MKAQASGRNHAPNASIPIAKTSATLLRSCKACGRTDQHLVATIQLGVSITSCPSCSARQFKFDDFVDDATRHALSVRFKDQMQSHGFVPFKLFNPKEATYV